MDAKQIGLNQVDMTPQFQNLVRLYELNPVIADQLFHVLNLCKIVVLCDDSGSMAQAIAE